MQPPRRRAVAREISRSSSAAKTRGEDSSIPLAWYEAYLAGLVAEAPLAFEHTNDNKGNNMATEAQILANRENAKKSTGPRTPEGKAISSRNAVNTGTAGRRCTLRAEDAVEYAKMGQLYVADLKPVGVLEQSLVEIIVDNQWQLNRVRAGLEEMCSNFGCGITEPIDQMVRMEKRLENSIVKCDAALRSRQKSRKAEENYGAILQFENEVEKPYKPKTHGHLPRRIGFVVEENELFVYFQQMEEVGAAKAQERADKIAARDAENGGSPRPIEIVIG